MADITADGLAKRIGIIETDLLAIEVGLMPLRKLLALQLSEVLELQFNDLWIDTTK